MNVQFLYDHVPSKNSETFIFLEEIVASTKSGIFSHNPSKNAKPQEILQVSRNLGIMTYLR